MRWLEGDTIELGEGEVRTVTIKLAQPAKGTSISTVAWAADPSLTIASETVSDTNASALISGQTAGQDYLLTVTATMASGQVHVGGLHVEGKAPGYENSSNRKR